MSRGLNKPFRINLTNARTGQGEIIPVTGKFIRVIDASTAAAECEIALRGDFNTSFFRMMEMANITERQGFDGIHVTNAAQPGEWLEIVVTDGPDDFDYERPMNNNIGQILEEVEVVSGSTPLNINSAGTDAALAAILAMMQNRTNQRQPLNSLQNCTYASGSASATIVASVSNVNGIRVARAITQPTGSGTVATFTAGGNVFVSSSNVAWPDGVCEGLFIPPGQALAAAITGSANYYIWYEVL